MDRTRPVGYKRLSTAIALAILLAAFLVGRALFQRPVSPPPIPSAPAVPAPSVGKGTEILVDDFETGQTQGLFGERKNRLDAFQGTWARRPSYSVITKVLDTRPASVGYSLRIEFNKEGGWCGWYTLLNGIDVTKLNALTFWVKGEQGGERFDIGLADDTMQDLEIDAVYVGPVNAFIPQGVTREWQRVAVPLAPLRSELNLTRMGSLVLWFRYEGKGAIQIDDVAFAYDEQVERLQTENVPRFAGDAKEEAPRAMWIWKTDPVNRAEVRKELFEFSERTAMRVFYIFLGEEPITATAADNQKNLGQFLRECHERGIEVHALQGNPLWALKPYHAKVLGWVGSFLEFNQGRPVEERMDGVHMDIEPYLTQEWESGDRDRLKAEFLELLTACRALIDKQAVPGTETVPGTVGFTGTVPGTAGFKMGLAIPVFYKQDPEMEEKILAQLDYAALMDYYDTAQDIVENGRFHMDAAEKAGIKMVIGVETQDLVQMNQGKRRNTFIEEGWEEMERELAKVADAFSDRDAFGGIAIHYYDSYRLLQRGRNVPRRERSAKIPALESRKAEASVTVDADLSDWADAVWMAVDQKNQVVYGAGAWGWGQDLSYKASIRWEPQALLLALDVTDNALVQEKTKADLWEGDHFEVWFDADLYSDFNEAVNSGDDFQLGLSPGNFKELPPEVHVWVPTVNPETLKQVEIAARPKPDGYVMEIRLPTSFLFQNVEKRVGIEPTAGSVSTRASREQLALQQGVLASGELKSGFRLGIMIDGSDTDAANQPQKCLLSTSPERQWGDPTSFNVLELK